MRNKLKYLFTISIFLFIAKDFFAQVSHDSLWSIWHNEIEADTVRLQALDDIIWDVYVFNQPDSAFYYAKQQYDFAKKTKQTQFMSYALNLQGVAKMILGDYLNAKDYYEQSLEINRELDDKRAIASSLLSIGSIYYYQGDYTNAIDYSTQSLNILEELGDKQGVAAAYGNIGILYKEQGNFAKTIECYTHSLKIEEEIGNKKGMANAFENIGLIYQEQKEYEKAKDYTQRSMEISKELSDKQGIAKSLNSLGLICQFQDDYEKSIDHFTKSLKAHEELGDKKGIAHSLSNMGNLYYLQKEYSLAEDYQNRSLEIRKEIGDQRGIAISLTSLGKIYQDLGNNTKAISYSNEAMSIAQSSGIANEIKDAAKLLYKSYKSTAKYKPALSMFETYIKMRDSLNSETNQKEIIRQEYKYDYEKQAAEDSIKNEEARKVADALLTAEKAESKQQRQQTYFLYGGLGLALLFGGFIFNRFRVTSRQKNIIEDQKSKVDEAYDQLEEKNNEILDSINYAKRIQSAILPPDKLVKEYLENSFILYQPKDIVAGDFYWMETVGNKILFAAADCTGHGVPGAMVSVVCNNGLNRSVREYGLTDPGKILDKTREIVIQEFEKSEDEVKDGMDIALCCLDRSTLYYAGAHNPLWIIRNGEIIEIKANKQPIGKFFNLLPYSTHKVELEKGDTFYVFSDGYPDQFGGEKGKKYKSGNFKKLLISIQDKSMEKQKEFLLQEFETWRGFIEQIDDVCVIGVRI